MSKQKHTPGPLSFNQAIEHAVGTKVRGELDAQFKIEVEGETWTCYTVTIADRDILCFCDQGHASFLVDSYGQKHVAELWEWERTDTGGAK